MSIRMKIRMQIQKRIQILIEDCRKVHKMLRKLHKVNRINNLFVFMNIRNIPPILYFNFGKGMEVIMLKCFTMVNQ